jgi:hypothetical protein
MKMENGATYGEFVVLRALRVKGGEAPFSELSKIHLRGIERLLCRMLPPRSRQKGVPGRQTMKRDGPRPALVQRRFVGSALHYRLTKSGWKGANYSGPWARLVGRTLLEWTPDLVEGYDVEEGARTLVASFSASLVSVDVAGIYKNNPTREDWKTFQTEMKRHYRLQVPHEAMPDQLRWPPGFAAACQKRRSTRWPRPTEASLKKRERDKNRTAQSVPGALGQFRSQRLKEMTTLRRLLKSIEPRAGESIQSLAIRLAPRALVTPDELLRFGLGHAAGLPSLPTDRSAIDCLSELGGFNLDDVRTRGVLPGTVGCLVYKREVPFDWVNLEVRRLAPGVLINDGDTPFHRLAWQLNALDCDLGAGEALLERCPQCGALLRWGNIESVVDCGNCHFDVRRAPLRYAPADHLSSARKLYAFMLRLGPPFHDSFQGLHDITLCHAMEFLAFFVNKHLRPSCQNAAAGLEELYSWPISFDRIVREEADLLRQSIGGKCYRYASLVETIERTRDAPLRWILIARAKIILQAPNLCALADQERRLRQPHQKRTDDLFDED